MSIAKEIAELAKKINWRGKFIGLTYRSKESGELARYVLQIGTNYGNLLEKSLSELDAMPPANPGLEMEARQAVRDSLVKSIEASKVGKNSEDYTKNGVYSHIDGTPLKVNLNNGKFELSGVVISKTVLEPGTHKTVNSKPLTIAKQKIEKQLPKSKFRTFSLDKEAFESARISGEEITV